MQKRRKKRWREVKGKKKKMKPTIWVFGCERKMEERRNERRREKGGREVTV